MGTRPDLPRDYIVATTTMLDETLKVIEVDRLVEWLSRPMTRHEIRSELETIHSKLVPWVRVVDGE